MKKNLLITTLLFSILTVNADEFVGRTYIVNEDGTVQSQEEIYEAMFNTLKKK